MKNYAWLIAIAITVCACGEFSYKRGASVAQLENARQTCQSKTTDTDVEKCMEDNGWIIQKLDSFEILTDSSTKTDETAADEKELLDSDKSAVYDEKTTTQEKPKTTENVKSIKPAKKSVVSNPLDTFVVPSWWKTGVKPDAFKTDGNACVEKLGEAHKPDGKTQTVTFAFIGCMGEKGWKAFKKPQ